MSSSERSSLQIDFGLVALVLLLSFTGLATLWSASHGADGQVASYAARQLQWMGIGSAAAVACLFIDYRHLQSNAFLLYAVLVALLVAVLVVGKTSMGAQRWLPLGPVRIQPSELMKIGIAVVVARVLAGEPARPPYGLRQLVKPLGLALVPAAMILLQPDLGTAILVAGVAGAMIAFQGVNRRVIVSAFVAVAAAAPLFWAYLKDYQRQRILTFLDPERDPTGAGYHIIQSKIALGSGRFLGKGYLEGTQSHLKFLPERHTDFIFSVLGEEWGFVGSLAVVLLYAFLVLWGLDIAAKARDGYGRLLAVGLTSILFFHAVINMGMVMGLLPVVGVPLPLFSYGGSSVLTTFLIIGLLLNIRMRRFFRKGL